MRPSPVRLHSRHIVALASLVELALAVGCNGQGAFSARDAAALYELGGATGTGGGTAGSGPGTGGDTSATGGTAGSSAATGGIGGAVSTGGSMGGHAGAGTGGMAGGGGGQAGTGGVVGTGGTPGKTNGMTCKGPGECSSNFCVDGVCCESACTGPCVACSNAKTGQGDGNCRAEPAGQDYDGDCPTTPMNSCGSTGQGCNGSGQCKKWAAGTVCDSTVTCDASFSSVIPGKICNGSGTCQAAPGQSCNGFLCSTNASGASCGTTCTDDSSCVSGGFCSAAACVGVPNLAGNGDVETGMLSGWSAQNGGGTLQVSALAVGGFSHTGQYSIQETGRSIYYAAPGYAFPLGLGKYNISVWARQNDDINFPGVLQVRLNCAGDSSYIAVLQSFSQNMPMGTWTQLMGTIDTTNATTALGLQPDCLGPSGLVKSAFLYLNQPDYTSGSPPVPNALPDLYMDDLVIQVPDGHNLISNSGIESGYPDGWTASATPSLLQPTANQKNGGMYSLWLSKRAATTTGISYTLPTGAARYKVTFNAMHTGTMPHPLVIQPAYTCIGGTPKFGPQITLPGSGGPGTSGNGEWVTLTGTVTMPPASEAAGCVLQQAAVTLQQGDTGACSTVECPDLYLDDASITIPVQSN